MPHVTSEGSTGHLTMQAGWRMYGCVHGRACTAVVQGWSKVNTNAAFESRRTSSAGIPRFRHGWRHGAF